jgi:acyl carrier protein
MINGKILNTISEVLKIKMSKLNNLSDYNNTTNWDSLATTNIIIALEEEFDIDIELDDAENFISVQNIINILEEKYI